VRIRHFSRNSIRKIIRCADDILICGEYDDLDSLYGLACGLTDSENQGGILKDFGVVTVSGFGDGEYKVMIGKNHEQKIISVSIIFLEDEEY
jgi:hypothetical protein